MEYLSVSYVFDQAWNFAKKNAVMLVCAYLVYYVVNYLFSSFAAPDLTNYMQYAQSGNIDAMLKELISVYVGAYTNPMKYISWIVSSVMMIGVYKMILDAVKGDVPVSFSSVKMEPMVYVKCIVVMLIYDVALYVGLSFCFVPGIFLGVKLVFAQLYQLENPNASIGESLSASWNMTSDNFWQLLVMAIVAFLVAAGGLLLCCVGVLFTFPLAYVMFVITYLTILKNL